MGAHRSADASAPASHAVAVTKSDATVFPVTRALYVGTSGNVTVRMASGAIVEFKNVPAGVFPVQVDQVRDATVPTDILALY